MATTQQPLSSEQEPCRAPSPATAPADTAPLLERLAAYRGLMDGVLLGLVVLFAIHLASFPAHNSDFLMHAASGRLLAQGQYVFGVDPFSYTTAGIYWANHSWLTDLVFYGLFSLPAIGGAAVVLFKALSIGLLALVLLQASRRPGQNLCVPAICTALTLLALSPRLLLQSSCLSFLFLGLTLWLLLQPHQRSDASSNRWRSYWWLPPLFVLWVNCDKWFLLGPAAVALYLLGEAMHQWPLCVCSKTGTRLLNFRSRVPVLEQTLSPPAERETVLPGSLRALTLLLVSGLAACLINPHHVHAVVLPWELGLTAAGDALAQDPELRYLFGSPLQEILMQTSTGLNLAASAYIPLLLLGLLSFALTWGMWRWERLSLWLGFLALSIVTYRAVPFFAIVSAPITSLNFLDFAARRYRAAAWSHRVRLGWSVGGRAAVLVMCAALVIAAVPGWLHPASARRAVAWGVSIDPSLRRAALQLRTWREQGLMAEGARVFNTRPDVAAYLAWFCPGERSFMDLRLSLFPESARDFVAVRNALAANPQQEAAELRPDENDPAWRPILRKWDIRYVFFNTPNPHLDSSQIVEQRLLLNPDGWPDEWSICYLDGRTMIAGWHDRERAKEKNSYERLRLERARLAFGPQGQTSAEAVPPPRLSADEAALCADEAFLHLLYYQLMGPRWRKRNRQTGEGALAAGLCGCAAAPGGPLANGTLLWARLDFTYRVLHGQPIAPYGARPQPLDLLAERLLAVFLNHQDSGPPEALFLTIRAARRALREDRKDAATSLLLGEAYLELAWNTRERNAARTMPLSALIRQTQAIAALEQAARLDPNLERAHALLVELYDNAVQLPVPHAGKPWQEQLVHRPNLESVQRHRRELLRCWRQRGPRPGEAAAIFARRVEQLNKLVQESAAAQTKRLDQWEVASAEKPLHYRVQLALEQGLNETGLNLLLQSDVPASSTGPARSILGQRTMELLLGMGRLQEARNFLDAETPQTLGMLSPPLALPAHEWYTIQLAAAAGDYEEADQRLTAMLTRLKDNALPPSAILAQTVGHELLWEAPLAATMPWQLIRRAPALVGLPPNPTTTLVLGLQKCLFVLQQETDLQTVRGWLALERGDTAAARVCLEQVLDRCRADQRDRVLPLRAGPLAQLYGAKLRAYEHPCGQ